MQHNLTSILVFFSVALLCMLISVHFTLVYFFHFVSIFIKKM